MKNIFVCGSLVAGLLGVRLAAEPVTWTNAAGVSITGNSLTKTGTNGSWNAAYLRIRDTATPGNRSTNGMQIWVARILRTACLALLVTMGGACKGSTGDVERAREAVFRYQLEKLKGRNVRGPICLAVGTFTNDTVKRSDPTDDVYLRIKQQWPAVAKASSCRAEGSQDGDSEERMPVVLTVGAVKFVGRDSAEVVGQDISGGEASYILRRNGEGWVVKGERLDAIP
jgi:hypothetical protein